MQFNFKSVEIDDLDVTNDIFYIDIAWVEDYFGFGHLIIKYDCRKKKWYIDNEGMPANFCAAAFLVLFEKYFKA